MADLFMCTTLVALAAMGRAVLRLLARERALSAEVERLWRTVVT